MSAATRRAALGAILATPLASVPAGAAQSTPSEELIRIIAEHDCVNALLDASVGDDGLSYDNDLIRAAGAARCRVLGFQSRGMADIMAKVACVARLWPLSDLQFEVDAAIRTGTVYIDNVADGIVLELAKLAEGRLCA